MKLSIIDDEVNYTAMVVELGVIEHLPGLDNLRGIKVGGNLVLISKDHEPGELGVFFPAESQLSAEFCRLNNLFKHKHLNADSTQKGYIEDTRRVKALKLKGYVSTGLWLPLDCFVPLFGGEAMTLQPGEEFNRIDAVDICRKYVRKGPIQVARSSKAKKAPREQVDINVFKEHVKTTHLLKCSFMLDLNDIVRVSIKLHGTSARVGLVPVHKPMTIWRRMLRKLGVEQKLTTYKLVAGSRQVIKYVEGQQLGKHGDYYGEDLWTLTAKQFEGKLAKGEVVYYEIVGWTPGGRPIQKGYTYGLPQGEHAIFVYRIANVNEDGVGQDLSWSAMRLRCVELGVNTVPFIGYGYMSGFLFSENELIDTEWRETRLPKYVARFMDRPSVLDRNIVEEGIVMTVERLGTHTHLKAKSPKFLLHETAVLDAEDDSVGDE